MKKNRLLVALLWAMIAAILLSSVALLTGGRLHLVNGEAYGILERYAKLEAVRSTLVKHFYREVDEDELMDGAIRGMMEALGDPYSFYYTTEQMAAHDASIEGVYDGLGMLILEEAGGAPEVLRVYEGSPADAAGIKAGDRIIAVDGAAVGEGEAARLLTGENGAEARLTILRDGEEMEISVVRSSVHYSNVSSSMMEGGVGYIDIFQFTGDDVEAFSAALERLQEAEMTALVIDLRNNPGGLLEDVAAITDMLLDEGLIVYTEDRSGNREEFFAEAGACDVPLAVLVNGMSASASEILAAAVQDLGRGAIIGTQTYGKGVVQALVSFPEDGSGMQYTFSSYYTPSGRSIQGEGVTPDLVVEAGEGMRFLSGIPDMENDAQLCAAVDWLEMETGE